MIGATLDTIHILCLIASILTLKVLKMLPQPTASIRPLRPPKSKSNNLILAHNNYPNFRQQYKNSLLPSLLRLIINIYINTVAVSSMQLIATFMKTTPFGKKSTMLCSLSVMAMIKSLAWTIGSSETPGTPPGAIRGTLRSKWMTVLMVSAVSCFGPSGLYLNE